MYIPQGCVNHGVDRMGIGLIIKNAAEGHEQRRLKAMHLCLPELRIIVQRSGDRRIMERQSVDLFIRVVDNQRRLDFGREQLDFAPVFSFG